VKEFFFYFQEEAEEGNRIVVVVQNVTSVFDPQLMFMSHECKLIRQLRLYELCK
jgi:hypothetical protein